MADPAGNEDDAQLSEGAAAELERTPRQPREDAPEQHEGPTPEEALADARRRLTEQETARQAAEQRAEQERQRAEQAQQEAHRARSDVNNAREQSLLSAIEAATSKQARAQALVRSARDQQDWDTHDKAQQDLAEATADLRYLSIEKRNLDNWKQQQANRPPPQPQQQPQRQVQQPQQQDEELSPAAKRWIDEHPRFNTDDNYRALAIGAHNTALRNGCVPDTTAYFDHINRTMNHFFPEDGMNGKRAPASSTAAPPSRASTPNVGRGTPVDANAIARDIGCEVDDLRDAARINGMKFEDYIKEQATILAERKAGRDTGLRRSDQGNFR